MEVDGKVDSQSTISFSVIAKINIFCLKSKSKKVFSAQPLNKKTVLSRPFQLVENNHCDIMPYDDKIDSVYHTMGFYSLFFSSFRENRSPKQFRKSSFLWEYHLHVNLLGTDVLGIFYCFF